MGLPYKLFYFVQDLNADTVGRNWTVLATLGGLAVGALALGLLGHLWDQRERRSVASELFASHAALSRGGLVHKTPQRIRNNAAPNADDRVFTRIIAPDGSHKEAAPWPTSPNPNPPTPAARGIRRPPVAKDLLERGADPTHLLEDSLPQVLQMRRRLVHRMAHEMAQHHRWLAVLTRYSETFPRSLRVLSLATNIVVMLFMQALVYTLSNPDDGTCGKLASPAACLRPRADFSGGGLPKCSWKPQQQHGSSSGSGGGGGGGGECSFVEPSDAVVVVMFVALFSAVVSAPIAAFLHMIIQNTLAAPTSHPDSPPATSAAGSRKMEKKKEKVMLLQSLFAGGAGWQEKEKEEQAEEDRQVHLQLVSLQQALQKHRAALSAKDRAEFDGILLLLCILYYSTINVLLYHQLSSCNSPVGNGQ